VTGEGASAAVSWLVTAFLDAVFGFLLLARGAYNPVEQAVAKTARKVA
jgi:hypothetical protein